MTRSALRRQVRRGLLVISAILAISSAVGAAESVDRPPPLPEFDNGLAARHPGDVGIEADERVLFAEDFEEALLEDVFKRWTSVGNKNGRVLRLSGDVPDRRKIA